MTRHEARAWLVEFLLDKVREDRYPSPTHLALIEKWISRGTGHLPEHPHARRIRRVAERLPQSEHGYSRERVDAGTPAETSGPRERAPTPSAES
jgi:hypothetical protein